MDGSLPLRTRAADRGLGQARRLVARRTSSRAPGRAGALPQALDPVIAVKRCQGTVLRLLIDVHKGSVASLGRHRPSNGTAAPLGDKSRPLTRRHHAPAGRGSWRNRAVGWRSGPIPQPAAKAIIIECLGFCGPFCMFRALLRDNRAPRGHTEHGRAISLPGGFAFRARTGPSRSSGTFQFRGQARKVPLGSPIRQVPALNQPRLVGLLLTGEIIWRTGGIVRSPANCKAGGPPSDAVRDRPATRTGRDRFPSRCFAGDAGRRTPARRAKHW